MPLNMGETKWGLLFECLSMPATLGKSHLTPNGAYRRMLHHMQAYARKVMCGRGPQKCIAENGVLAGAPWEHSVMGSEGKGAVAGVQRCQCFCHLHLLFSKQSPWCHGLASSVLQQNLAPSCVSSAQECRTGLTWIDMVFDGFCPPHALAVTPKMSTQ